MQTLSFDEHPAPTTYANATETATVAHNGTHLLDAALFNGTANAPEAIRITRISGGGAAQDAPRALILNKGEAGEKVLSTEGPDSVVQAADFGKITWDASVANGGSFTFTPALANGTPIIGAATQTVNIHESPVAPDYSATARVEAQHDANNALLPENVFTGAVGANKPASVRILEISPTGGAQDQKALYYTDAGGVRHDVKVNDTISADNFAKVMWDASVNEGGSFRFQAVDGSGHDIAGSAPRTVTVREHPTPPDYNGQPTVYGVQHDGTLWSHVDRLGGNASGTKPTHIVVQDINPQNATPGSVALTLNGKPVELNKPIAAADFNQLQWNAAVNEGGTITFAPALADGTVILGSTPQTIAIHEHPQAPVYPSTPNDVGIRLDGVDEIPPSVFRGEAQDRAASYVKITAITPSGGAGTPLMLDADGAGNAAPQEVKVGQTIDLSKLAADARLTWDTTSNTGGTVRFVPVLENGTQILGSTEHQLNIVEHGPAPTYPAATQTVSVPNNGTALLSASLFTGTANAPQFIQIGEVPGRQAGQQKAPAALILHKGTPDQKVLATDDVIEARDFDKITWDASVMEGGAFSFTPVRDKAGTPFAGATEQRVEIRESGVAPDYSKTPVTTVAHDGSKLLPEANLMGADANRKP
ncbi:MAG: hypothetical protein Q4D19_07910, partial [Lautropia sp.]|nr:hypothetical protein [Lautropia sp.]